MDWVSPHGGLTDLAAVVFGWTEDRDTQRLPRKHGRLRAPSGSLVDSAVLRPRFVREIAGELNQDAGPQIIVGDTGSGTTMFLLELARYLAKNGQVPVSLKLRGADEIDFAEQARASYLRLTKTAKGEEEAKKRWEWLKQRKLITILADDLEQSDMTPEERQAALARASRFRLRLAVAARPYGLPSLHHRAREVGGRIDLPELDSDEVHKDLIKRACRARQGHLDDRIKALVEKAEMTSTPYYLSLARVLVRIGALDEVHTEGDVQLGLVHGYRKAFEDGRVKRDDGLTIATRVAVFKRLEAIAYFAQRHHHRPAGHHQPEIVRLRHAPARAGERTLTADRLVFSDRLVLGCVSHNPRREQDEHHRNPDPYDQPGLRRHSGSGQGGRLL
jgi:hypothetical protein